MGRRSRDLTFHFVQSDVLEPIPDGVRIQVSGIDILFIDPLAIMIEKHPIPEDIFRILS